MAANPFCPQDVTHKVVEAIGTIAGSSLEQTTWLRRNLEVKPSPQIVVDGTNLEADVEGLQTFLKNLKASPANVGADPECMNQSLRSHQPLIYFGSVPSGLFLILNMPFLG